MKKKVLAIVVLLCLSLIAFVGCSVSTPSGLEYANGVISWERVDNATSYTVWINSTEYTSETNSFTLPDGIFGEVTIKVSACNSKSTSAPAEITKTIVLTLPTPQNIRQQGNKLLWDEVSGTNGYVVRINGAEYFASEAEFTFNSQASGVVQVLAVGRSDGIVLSSAYSSPLTIKTTLASPTNIAVSNGVITWTAVQGADKYVVTLNDSIVRESFTNSLSVKYELFGETNIKVKAVSNNSNLYDSDVAEATCSIEKATLQAPQGVAIANDVLSFDAVQGATSYDVYQNGKFVATITSLTYSLTESQIDEGGYMTVVATSPTCNSSTSSDKALIKLSQISTPAQLAAMTEYGCYQLTQSITLTETWQPIAFGGVLDGNGFTISGIVIDADDANVGFFSTISDATIKNLTLEGSINVASSVINANIGGLAGKAIGSSVKNCNVNVDVTVAVTNGIGNVGGVFGATESTSAEKVNYCGTISSENSVVGGFAGKAFNPSIANVIEKCIVDATITCDGGEQAISGGFIGKFIDNTLIVRECKANVQLTGTCYVGCFVGYMGTGKIENCYSSGNVTATGTTLVHVGGFIGRLEGYNNFVVNCLSLSQVTCTATGDNILKGGFVGRTVGGSYNNVYTNCLYDNTLSPLDRIGNSSSGRGDGIIAMSTEELKQVSTYSSFDNTIWTCDEGDLPRLSFEE